MRDGDHRGDEVDQTLARLLDAIAAEPVPQEIRALAEQLRGALQERDAVECSGDGTKAPLLR